MLKHIITTYKNNQLICVSLIIAILLSLTPWAFVGLIICLILWAVIWPFPKQVNSLVLRLFLSFCLVATFTQLLGVVAWITNLSYTPAVVVMSQVLVVFVLLVFSGPRKKLKIVTRADLSALSVSLFCLLLIGFGAFRSPLATNLLQSSTNAFDDTIHTSLSITVYENQGYVYGKSENVIDKVVYKALVAYPQGWHLSNSVWWHSISDDVTSSHTRLMLFYIVSKLVWFCLIVFLVCRLILSLVEYTMKRSLSIVEYLCAPVLTVLCLSLLLFGVYKFGFSSFMPVLAFLLCLPFFLIPLANKKEDGDISNLVSITLLSGGMSLSWLLAAPIGYFAGFMAILERHNFNLNDVWKWLKASWKKLMIILPIFLLGVSQLFIELSYNENVGLINNDGGIWDINRVAFLLVLLVSFVAILKLPAVVAKPYSYLMYSAMALAGLIYAYQFATAGRPTYYSTKIAYLPFLLVFVLASAYILTQVRELSESKGKLVAVMALSCTVLILPYALNLDLKVAGQVAGRKDLLSNESSQNILSKLDDSANSTIVVFKNINYEEDIIAGGYANMLGREQSECESNITWLQISNDDEGLAKKIVECAQKNKHITYYVIASQSNYDSLSSQFKQIDNIELQLSN